MPCESKKAEHAPPVSRLVSSMVGAGGSKKVTGKVPLKNVLVGKEVTKKGKKETTTNNAPASRLLSPPLTSHSSVNFGDERAKK